MELITGAILSGIIYDMFKSQASLTATNLKTRLQNWAVSDSTAQAMEKELNELKLSDEMSELAIERKIASSIVLKTIMGSIKPNNNSVIQNHSGEGDNVAGNKYNYR